MAKWQWVSAHVIKCRNLFTTDTLINFVLTRNSCVENNLKLRRFRTVVPSVDIRNANFFFAENHKKCI